jgi:hypothetical protein
MSGCWRLSRHRHQEIIRDSPKRGAGTSTAQTEGVRRLWTILLISALSLSGVAVAADALVTTQREELDGFLDSVSRDRLDARIDGALAYMNPSAVELRIQNDGKQTRFVEGESETLAQDVRATLGVFDSTKQDLLQHSVKVDGDHATVTTRMGDNSYEQTVIYDLVRRDERWLVRSLRVL